MKLCAYCGQQNGDLVFACAGCGTTEFKAIPPHPAETGLRTADAKRDEAQRCGMDAWKCGFALVLSEYLFLRSIHFVSHSSPAFASWWGHAPAALALSVATQATVFLVLVWYFSRAKSLGGFLSRTGMSFRPSPWGWGLAWVAVGIGFIDLFWVDNGLSSSSRPSARAYYTGLTDAARYFSAFTGVLIVPLYEEIATRGFLYTAFRKSYGPSITTVLILIFSAYFHWGAISHSPLTTMSLVSLWILVCLVRERTSSLWNCVICHVAYNAVVSREWRLCLAGMVVALPFFLYSRKVTAKTSTAARPNA